MFSPTMNREDDRASQRVKVALTDDIARRLRNFAVRAEMSLSEAGAHFIALGMDKQVALNRAAQIGTKFVALHDTVLSSPETEIWDR